MLIPAAAGRRRYDGAKRMQAKTDWSRIFRDRRNEIRSALGGGTALWIGHILQPRTYRDNTYPFRQNSHFLYYTGLTVPDLALLSYPEPDHDVLFWRPTGMDDIVWSGSSETGPEIAGRAGVETVEDIARLGVYLAKARKEHGNIHYLPPYQASSMFRIAELLIMDWTEVVTGASESLIEAVARQRSVKTELELSEIEAALRVTDRMHRHAMAKTQPGAYEYEIAGAIQGIALSEYHQQAYNPIVTVRGEVLHNHSHEHELEDGQLLLIDAGSESSRFYASDITRTFPVNGKYSSEQKDIYETVLRAQLGAIDEIRPDASFREVHLHAAEVMVEGLKSIGLMRGGAGDAVAAGAHALFFPHGLGHMLGLDVHDMEDLGDAVGYRKGASRSKQFGLSFLRLNRTLQQGYVLTVEPGLYFIPALIDRWQQERRHADFIDYDRLERFRAFGGIRIEDNVVVTAGGARVLGPGIPKTIAEVEAAMAG